MTFNIDIDNIVNESNYEINVDVDEWIFFPT